MTIIPYCDFLASVMTRVVPRKRTIDSCIDSPVMICSKNRLQALTYSQTEFRHSTLESYIDSLVVICMQTLTPTAGVLK